MTNYRVGIDIGSTTIKVVVVDESDAIIYKTYDRHKSSITKSLQIMFKQLKNRFANEAMHFNFTGSAGLDLAKAIGAQFTQEVISATSALRHSVEGIDVAVEIGGEDAKIMFFDGANVEQRMNGTCAGGTGAFIDQMASLLDTDAEGVNELAKDYEKLHDIASRCGVFAKSDIQPLLNQGAQKADIAASIYQAIVNQTVAGLSQGRKIKGKVAFLGGPLTFASELRKRFIETLNLEDVYMPEFGEVFVAFGAAIEANETPLTIDRLIKKISDYRKSHKEGASQRIDPLFKNDEEYKAFKKRHNHASLITVDPADYEGNAYLGIDAGSTTTKMILIGENDEMLYQYYAHNRGNPVEIVKNALLKMYDSLHEGIIIKQAYSTGYGEALIKNGFNLDGSEVETICHYEAAKHFKPDVNFVVDIGGQDMKCFKVENGVITSIILNEACSSGCGSFIESFSESLGYKISEFSDMALASTSPVDLGSRCTVFMNSSVKQAQAEAALTEDISAGLAMSVVKNALYKVIRAHDVKEEYGDKIIVQGGTFTNDAVLRAFEKETGADVTRPSIAGLMGAFGAALLAREHSNNEVSGVLTKKALKTFSYDTKRAVCNKCENRCPLTVNIFGTGKKYISGNRCEKGAGIKVSFDDVPNLYLYKYDKLRQYLPSKTKDYKATVGIPFVLNMYENIPFYQPFFDALNIKVVYSDRSNKKLYEKGQDTIPSDTICYPAKLVHGHIENLYEKDTDFIFYPNMPYNIKEKLHGDNFYNCPVVAHYPEVIDANMTDLDLSNFVIPYLTLSHKKKFINEMKEKLKPFISLKNSDLSKAYDIAMDAYNAFRKDVQKEGERALTYAKKHGLKTLVMAGRPYHIDPEINHGIPKLIRSFNVVLVSEDAINHLADQDKVNILNQWTYHTRLYDSARAIVDMDNVNLVQLVSFGCGLDAITSDEVKDILESHGKLYTQMKIDEISNLGAVNIRLRSLLSTMNKEGDTRG
jgi:predicted CoA-substrate-specific enzyme activase